MNSSNVESTILSPSNLAQNGSQPLAQDVVCHYLTNLDEQTTLLSREDLLFLTLLLVQSILGEGMGGDKTMLALYHFKDMCEKVQFDPEKFKEFVELLDVVIKKANARNPLMSGGFM